MIKAKDAIAAARSLIGTPYAQLDCINLIKKVIRTSPGGAADYTTAGTNTLWRSYEASSKYRDLTWRQDGVALPDAGMLAFKASGDDWHHVGIVTEEGTVIHSSSAYGGRGVVETPLSEAEGWTHLAMHRHIETEGLKSDVGGGETMEEYTGVVVLSDINSTLNVRNAPDKEARRIGRLSHGAQVRVLADLYDSWLYIDYGESVNGYVAKQYIQRVEEEKPDEEPENVIVINNDILIVDSAGNEFRPQGGWRVIRPGND